MSGDAERRDGLRVNALNPWQPDKVIEVFISFERMQVARKLGMVTTQECALIVPNLLRDPFHVFEGLREDDDEDRHRKTPGWLCYCAIPEHAYREDGSKRSPYPGQLFLVFVNDENVAYNWRWEKADPRDEELPARHEQRFEERVYERHIS